MKLVARALLARDALKADEYGGLSFGPAARPILKGEEPMELVLPPNRQRRRGERVPNPEGDPLFEALHACRRALAKAAGTPPYVVINTSTRPAMAELKTTTTGTPATTSAAGAPTHP